MENIAEKELMKGYHGGRREYRKERKGGKGRKGVS